MIILCPINWNSVQIMARDYLIKPNFGSNNRFFISLNGQNFGANNAFCNLNWLKFGANNIFCNLKEPKFGANKASFRIYGAYTTHRQLCINNKLQYVCGWKYHAQLKELWSWTETLEISLMADFSANWSASDWPVSSYNLGTEVQIEAPQAPEDRAR